MTLNFTQQDVTNFRFAIALFIYCYQNNIISFLNENVDEPKDKSTVFERTPTPITPDSSPDQFKHHFVSSNNIFRENVSMMFPPVDGANLHSKEFFMFDDSSNKISRENVSQIIYPEEIYKVNDIQPITNNHDINGGTNPWIMYENVMNIIQVIHNSENRTGNQNSHLIRMEKLLSILTDWEGGSLRIQQDCNEFYLYLILFQLGSAVNILVYFTFA